MDKIKIGIPRALHYYYYGALWKEYLENLGCEVVISPKTTKEIVDQGCKIANDEMCLSLKIYLGHVSYLESKCDYILVPRIDNYGQIEQTCTNFLGLYDIVRNLFQTPLLTYNVDEVHHQTEMNGFIDLGLSLKKGKEQCKIAYLNSIERVKKQKAKKRILMNKRLESENIKLLIVSHPYNLEDCYIGGMIERLLSSFHVEMIDAGSFVGKESKEKGQQMSPNLYWKYSKELIGTIELLKDKVDGVLFLTSFPCGPDSMVNELLFRKLKLPHLNLILDDTSGEAGMETRLESFIDILEQKRTVTR